jgi:hypothetical protein
VCSFQKLIFSTAAKIFSSSSRIKTDGEGVGFLNPLLAMAQVVNVSRPGCEPDIRQEVVEDVRLMCSSLADKKGKQGLASKMGRYMCFLVCVWGCWRWSWCCWLCMLP